MNPRLRRRAKGRDTSELEFTAQLAKTLSLTPAATDEWPGVFLERYMDHRHSAAAGTAGHEAASDEVKAPVSIKERRERAAA